MPKLAKSYNTQNFQNPAQTFPHGVVRPLPKRKPLPHSRIKRVNPLKSFLSLTFLCLFATFVMPVGFQRVTKPLIFNGLYKEIEVNVHDLLMPTTMYLTNSRTFNLRSLEAAETKKPQMTSIYATEKMPVLEVNLRKLMNQYKTLNPSIYVWDFNSGKYVDIDAEKIYPAASIIKIPVLISLFKAVEAGDLTIYDEMVLTDYYKASGSGELQYKQSGSKYSVDSLARLMITDSDNSATNMLMAKEGSMTAVNQALRDWGIGKTQVKNWLPDIEGTNYTTAKDMSTMLYNLDNPSFLNLSSREYIVDYMSKVKNNRLIQAGLAPKALFIHKTGDIGKMLGDAGIVYLPNGEKYIVTILVKRPYNSPQGKEFIQKASSLIYNSIVGGKY